MENIIIVERNDKYCFAELKEAVKQFLGNDFYNLNETEKYKRIRMKTAMNAHIKNIPITDLKKGNNIDNIEKEQYIVLDEETFLLMLAKNNDIVIYEKEDANILARNINKEKLERIAKNYIRINDCVNELIKNKLKGE